MSTHPLLENHVRELRSRRGWSQAELANRAGLSRAGVSAIEMGRLVPSAAAALTLAAALECRVEDVFRLPSSKSSPSADAWAWPPKREPCRYWRAEVDGRSWLYPVEATPRGVVAHDGIFRDGGFFATGDSDPTRTLVIATCDPAAGLLASEIEKTSRFRVLVIPRSSRAALTNLSQGFVHAAGVHLATAENGGNAGSVRKLLGGGYALLRVAKWDEGLAVAPALGLSTVRSALKADLRWVGREEGSGARQCLDELMEERGLNVKPPKRLAFDHRGIAEAVRCGWAEVGVCLRLPVEEAGLDFLEIRQEAYDLCYPEAMEADPRIRALIDAIRSPNYRRALTGLPGYDAAEAGVVQGAN